MSNENGRNPPAPAGPKPAPPPNPPSAPQPRTDAAQQGEVVAWHSTTTREITFNPHWHEVNPNGWRPLVYGDTAPPSAPVGVEALVERWRTKKRGLSALGCANELESALAQDRASQAAAPSAPVGVDFDLVAEILESVDYWSPAGTAQALAAQLRALAQQPAVVDVVKGYPLWQAIHAESAKAGHPCNVGLAQVIAALDALAAQQQGGAE